MKRSKILWFLVIISVITASISDLMLNMWFVFWIFYAVYNSFTGGK